MSGLLGTLLPHISKLGLLVYKLFVFGCFTTFVLVTDIPNNVKITHILKFSKSYLHVEKWGPFWWRGTAGWSEAGGFDCWAHSCTWPYFLMGQKGLAGPQRVSHICWAASPMSPSVSTLEPSSDHCEQKHDTWKKKKIINYTIAKTTQSIGKWQNFLHIQYSHLMMANMELKFLHSRQCKAILMKCFTVFIRLSWLGSLVTSVATQKVSWLMASSKRFRLFELDFDRSLNRSSMYSVGSMAQKSSKARMESCVATSTVLSCSKEIWLSRNRSWASSSEHNVSVSMLLFR